tara:strand:+ start:1949 stop:2338 length:390 start_codon:yes stop_codon:yes gene_type:complete
MIVEKYLKCWENVNSNNVSKLFNCLHDNFYFIDPFVEIHNKKEFEGHLQHTLRKYKKLQFDILLSLRKKNTYIIKWKMTLENKKFKPFCGISEIVMENNLIKSHVDFWDPMRNIYQNIPVLGKVLKLLT